MSRKKKPSYVPPFSEECVAIRQAELLCESPASGGNENVEYEDWTI